MKGKLENIFKSKLENLTEPAPDKVLKSLRTHYPKPSFTDIIQLNAAKIAIVTAVATIAIIAGVALLNNKNTNENLSTVNTTITEVQKQNTNPTIINNNNEKTIATNNTVNQKSEKFKKNTNTNKQEKQIEYRKIFASSDTSICDKEFFIKANLNINNISANPNISITKHKDLIKISSTDTGVYYLKYTDEKDNKIIIDSMRVCFLSLTQPKIEIVDNIKCPGDALLVKLNSDINSEVTWIADGANIEKQGNDYYKFAWQNQIEQEITIVASIKDNNCTCDATLSVNLPEPITINSISKPAKYGLNNGEISVKTNKENITYKLNGVTQNNGDFKNLYPGKHKLSVIYDKYCVKETEISVNSNQKLKLNFQHEFNDKKPMEVYLKNNSTIDNKSLYSNSDINFIWEIDEQKYTGESLKFCFDTEGEKDIKLYAYYKEKCIDSISKKLNVANDLLIIPNIFSPNGDGISDVFIVKTNNIKNFKAIITNTRGELIYQWDNPDGGWDGNINGNNLAAEGVYFYIIYAEFNSGKKVERKGSVNLVRY
ncbi:MAG: gliding motility-associated C-terminal domain-containing protein [Bacteroidales bacterium]|nr:gliding motility-associated C-terminal domain-containing protein [Bacteroidales bacterium]